MDPGFLDVDGEHQHDDRVSSVGFNQQGDLDKTVQVLKVLVQKADTKYHGEAYAALAKVLDDQGKHELADRAMTKSNRIYNDNLAKWTLF